MKEAMKLLVTLVYIGLFVIVSAIGSISLALIYLLLKFILK